MSGATRLSSSGNYLRVAPGSSRFSWLILSQERIICQQICLPGRGGLRPWIRCLRRAAAVDARPVPLSCVWTGDGPERGLRIRRQVTDAAGDPRQQPIFGSTCVNRNGGFMPSSCERSHRAAFLDESESRRCEGGKGHRPPEHQSMNRLPVDTGPGHRCCRAPSCSAWPLTIS